MRRAGRLGLAGVICLFAGCASSAPEVGSEPPPEVKANSKPQATDERGAQPSASEEPIPLSPEPSFQVPAELPAALRGASCLITVVGEGPEQQSFADAFVKEFLGAGFKKASQAPDLVVSLDYQATARASSPETARGDALIVGQGVARVTLSPARGSRQVQVVFKHEQPTTRAQEQTMRGLHAPVVGRLIANKTLRDLSQSEGPARLLEYTLVFKSYPRALSQTVVAAVCRVKGIDESSIRKRSSGNGSEGIFTLVASSELPAVELREAIASELAKEGLETEVKSEGNVLLFTRK